MIYCYLFEAKSIQQYLFRSGKLKDVIAASERLDRLIDSNNQSVLFHVLNNAGLKSDLLDYDNSEGEDVIHFLRCKGGAFYSYCETQNPLLALRSLWTLTVQQLFPSMDFTDALCDGDTLSSAMDSAHAQLASDRNNPIIKFPMGSPIADRYQRSGQVAVPVSGLASRASMKKEFDDDSFDIDTEHHRQAYQAFDMRHKAALQDRFTPSSLQGKIHYPVDIEKEFQTASDLKSNNKVATRDIALIHIDGNGLGILLMGLKNALNDKDASEYQQGFRQFSEALNVATIQAAQKATQWVYDNATYLLEGKTYLPMRPIVLGGDDVTLLCRADLALTFSQIFCTEFKIASKAALAEIYDKYLKGSEMKDHLTASGGILYNKAGHPFTHSHHLVEDLCDHAKTLTKSVNESDKEVGPAALAFYRISNSVSSSFDSLFSQSQVFQLNENKSINMGISRYFVETEYPNNLTALTALSDGCNQKNAILSMAKWRQMATFLAQGDFEEADALFNRAKSLKDDPKLVNQLSADIEALLVKNEETTVFDRWYTSTENKKHCLINDLLIIDHFRPVLAKGEANE